MNNKDKLIVKLALLILFCSIIILISYLSINNKQIFYIICENGSKEEYNESSLISCGKAQAPPDINYVDFNMNQQIENALKEKIG